MVTSLADPQFSWLREFAVPAFFTLFGAALGFLASYLLEKQKAKREEQNAKQAKDSFLRAIRMELDALGDQLDASLYEVKASTERAKSGIGPQIAATLRTSVFTTQLGKVRDVADPLMIQVIHYYSDLATLQEIIEGVNNLGAEFNRAEAGPRLGAQNRLLSGLRVLEEKIAGFGQRLAKLKTQLPSA